MRKYDHIDRRFGHVYRYHSRSDAHSVSLCKEILADILQRSPLLRDQAAVGKIVYGINVKVTAPASGKTKTLDLAIGLPIGTCVPGFVKGAPISEGPIREVLFSCEAKTVMTEHGKSKPRVYDELSSSHEIIHQGWPRAIATGITIVNIAPCFASPLRQTTKEKLVITQHKQPEAATAMVRHLRGLPQRSRLGQVGFDAYATLVVQCDNVDREVMLWSTPPAPQPGEVDYYESFLDRITASYAERFPNPA